MCLTGMHRKNTFVLRYSDETLKEHCDKPAYRFHGILTPRAHDQAAVSSPFTTLPYLHRAPGMRVISPEVKGAHLDLLTALLTNIRFRLLIYHKIVWRCNKKK